MVLRRTTPAPVAKVLTAASATRANWHGGGGGEPYRLVLLADAPSDTPEDAPVDAPVEIPVDISFDVPEQTLAVMPAEPPAAGLWPG